MQTARGRFKPKDDWWFRGGGAWGSAVTCSRSSSASAWRPAPGARLGDCGSQDFAASQMGQINASLRDEYQSTARFDGITPAAEVLRAAGFDYTCFDVDYREDTVYVDFHAFEFPRALYGTFDVTFNSGTSEHLIAPHGLMCFAHQVTKVGGLIWHAVPIFGYENHGLNNLTPKFWHQLAAYNGYEIVHAEIVPTDKSLHDPNNFFGSHLSFIKGLESYDAPSALIFIVFRKVIDRCFIPPFDIVDPSPSPRTEKLMRDALEPFVAAGSLTHEEVGHAMDSLFARTQPADRVVHTKDGRAPIQEVCDRALALSQAGDHVASAALWETIVEQHPDHAEARFQLAQELTIVARDRASDLVRQAADLDPGNGAYRQVRDTSIIPSQRQGIVRRIARSITG
ncbi:hypothetical protein NPA31_004030 [Aurantimonas sp. MSK8Z-1]|uniref:hypothetical protein n=1 Tax=Mangrovibrevibacter kandeliae TaxID=2968473 RepID=UPI0021180F1C|nr:hypothetical protein [Aurantimonas sp. MSK8Z-1]MCW4114133.1 hypothetical protein [Aurantimonas sp. MSK8Z-1]